MNRPARPGKFSNTFTTRYGSSWSLFEIFPAFNGSHPSKYAYMAHPVAVARPKNTVPGSIENREALEGNEQSKYEILFIRQ